MKRFEKVIRFRKSKTFSYEHINVLYVMSNQNVLDNSTLIIFIGRYHQHWSF